MPQNIKKGVTAFWWLEDVSLSTGAVTGATNAFASATGTMNFQKVEAERTSDRAEIRDKSNNVAGEAFSNDRYEGSFTGVPSGASDAASQTVNILPQAGNTVLFADSREAHLAIAWIIDSAKAEGDNSKAREITLKFHRYGDPNVTKDAI